MHVPQRWFNAYAGDRGETNGLFADPSSPQTKFKPNSIKEGDLLVHHAGHKSLRGQRMSPWMDVAEQHLPRWELDLNKTTYEQEIRDFWTIEAPKEKKRMDDQIKREAKKDEEKARLRQTQAQEAEKKKEADAKEAERKKQEKEIEEKQKQKVKESENAKEKEKEVQIQDAAAPS